MKALVIALAVGIFGFIAWKTVRINRKPKEDYKDDGGFAGIGAGEVPKDVKK